MKSNIDRTPFSKIKSLGQDMEKTEEKTIR